MRRRPPLPDFNQNDYLRMLRAIYPNAQLMSPELIAKLVKTGELTSEEAFQVADEEMSPFFVYVPEHRRFYLVEVGGIPE